MKMKRGIGFFRLKLARRQSSRPATNHPRYRRLRGLTPLLQKTNKIGSFEKWTGNILSGPGGGVCGFAGVVSYCQLGGEKRNKGCSAATAAVCLLKSCTLVTPRIYRPGDDSYDSSVVFVLSVWGKGL